MGTVPIYFRLPGDQLALVDALALAEGRSRSSMVVRLLMEGLESRASERAGRPDARAAGPPNVPDPGPPATAASSRESRTRTSARPGVCVLPSPGAGVRCKACGLVH